MKTLPLNPNNEVELLTFKRMLCVIFMSDLLL